MRARFRHDGEVLVILVMASFAIVKTILADVKIIGIAFATICKSCQLQSSLKLLDALTIVVLVLDWIFAVATGKTRYLDINKWRIQSFARDLVTAGHNFSKNMFI
jgi:hypothetical protein